MVQKINTHIDKIEAALGAVTDSFSSLASVTNDVINNDILSTAFDSFYRPHWEKRFGADESSEQILREVLNNIELLLNSNPDERAHLDHFPQ